MLQDVLTPKRDTDGDSINDQLDECPTTPPQTLVNGVGCASSERDTERKMESNDMDDFVSNDW